MTRRRVVVAAGIGILAALAAAGPEEARGDDAAPVPAAAVGAEATPGQEWTALALGDLSLRRQPPPAPPPERPALRRMRPNTISLGFQGQYGGVRGNSRIAEGFDHGPGYAFRFRYMVSTSAALGFSFEHQRYGSIQPPLNSGVFADSHVVITTVGAEGVFYIHRERELTPYVLGGFGFATPDIVFTELQSSRANEGVFAVVGAGFERFIRSRFSADVSIRGFALVSNAQFTSMAQVSVGIHLYPGD